MEHLIPRRMLYRNAPWILLLVCIFLVLVIYTTDDRSPSPGKASLESARMASHLDPSPGKFVQSTVFTSKASIRPNPLVIGKNKTRLKTILYWNEFYGRYDTYDFGYGRQAFLDNQCRVSTCFATQDRSLLPIDQFDAIIIHIRGLPNDIPAQRSPQQRYVMLSIEAPIYLFEYRDLNRLHFNWTMTYRIDSDFPIPYAWIDNVKPLPAPLGSTLLQRFIVKHGKEAATLGPNLADDKIGLAVQFVSNCHSASHREHYVRELQKHIPIDIYGKCGQFKCAKDKGMACFRMAEKKYKFYLAFENALCKDFATEKFFTMYSLNMIPVVLGGANYSSFAPPHSFINAADFDSPKALAHYLKILDSDDAKFNEYFWWRDFYRRQFHHHRSLCDLCERLHTDSRPSTYSDMQDWWVKQADCTNAFSRSSLKDYY
ncbi:alpha-(1,3)-fucosyltransferase C-like [Tigriopus californicus]|uniref:alpha-(1,3)-fucosyltransferase C-like n=1 Tax=Tigriopus californicus TaxID=6832 RepID=UPI0027D9E0F8|nr:alpha-(1,3)-fucosyltransferase C-like [Tigriopus californicus]